jgi:hypothetical protein
MRETCFHCGGLRAPNALRGGIEAGDVAATLPRQVNCGSAQPAADVEHTRPHTGSERGMQRVKLGSRGEVLLADPALAKHRMEDLGQRRMSLT